MSKSMMWLSTLLLICAYWTTVQIVLENINLMDTSRIRSNESDNLVFCTMVRDMAPYVAEWVSFHTQMGVSHFYIYDDLSTDSLQQVLRPWVDKGQATVIPMTSDTELSQCYQDKHLIHPQNTCQKAAFQHCVTRQPHGAKWAALVDVDEFFFSHPDLNVSLPETLRRLQTPQWAGIILQPFVFGTSGLLRMPANGSVLKTHLYREADGEPPSCHGDETCLMFIATKEFVHTWHFLWAGIHTHHYWADMLLSGFRNARTMPKMNGAIRFHHYRYLSVEDNHRKALTYQSPYYWLFNNSKYAFFDDTLAHVLQ